MCWWKNLKKPTKINVVKIKKKTEFVIFLCFKGFGFRDVLLFCLFVLLIWKQQKYGAVHLCIKDQITMFIKEKNVRNLCKFYNFLWNFSRKHKILFWSFYIKELSPRSMNQKTHEITIPKQHSKSIEEEPTSQSNKNCWISGTEQT